MKAGLLLLVLCLGFQAQAQDKRIYLRHTSLSFIDEDFSETSIAVDPMNPKHAVAGANVHHLFRTIDGGRRWRHQIATSEYGVYGDPVMHFAGSKLFYAHLSASPGKKYPNWFDCIVVQRLASIKPFVEKSYAVGYNEGKMQDKPWLSSDDHSQLYEGQVYLSWTEFDRYNSSNPEDHSRIRFAHYTPLSDTFSAPVTISDTVGNCEDGDETLEGATTAIGPKGEVYAVWAGYNKIYFDKSLDGGNSWGTDQVIGTQAGGWAMSIPHISRSNGMPFICTDNQNKIIYVCWADEFFGEGDIWLCYSKDQGESWSEKILVNRNHNRGHQYFPNMVFDDSLQSVRVIYFDHSRSETGLSYDIGMSTFSAIKHENGERQFADFYVSPIPNPMPGERFFFGDYIDVDQSEHHTFVAYPIYNGQHSSMGFTAFNTDSIGFQVAVPRHQVSAVVDRDTLYLLGHLPPFYKLKCKLKIKKNGKTKRLKFKFLSEDGAYKSEEVILAKIPLDSKEPVDVCLKYHLVNLGTKQSDTVDYRRKYP